MENINRKRLSRRGFLRLSAAAVVGVVIAGCKNNSNVITPAQTAVPASATLPTTALPAATLAPTDNSAAATQPPAPTGVPGATAQVMGKARGIFPGRVVWVHNPAATQWDGKTGLWWSNESINQGVVKEMVAQAIRQQTGQSDDKSAWDALFRSFNDAHGKSNTGFTAGEKIAIKANLNVIGEKHAYNDNGTFTAPQAVFALLEQLIRQAGVPADAITVYDAIRLVPDAIFDGVQNTDLKGVHFVDWTGGNGREQSQRDPKVQVYWSQDTKGSPTFLPTVVTQASYIINMASLKPHNLAGVTLCAKNHFGTIMSDWKGQATVNAPQGANIHGTVAAHNYSWGPDWTWPQAAMGSYNALVDLIGHPHLGAKTLLFFLDGLYVAHDQNAKITDEGRWQSAPFNNHWTSSILVSQDNLAIDSVGLDLILSEPTTGTLPDCLPAGSTPDNYLHEASQADKAPSGTVYKPDGKTVLASLGVHEHWNNGSDKQYSRNLKTGDGIELIKVA